MGVDYFMFLPLILENNMQIFIIYVYHNYIQLFLNILYFSHGLPFYVSLVFFLNRNVLKVDFQLIR